MEDQLLALIGENAVLVGIAVFVILCVFPGVRVVPRSEKYVAERFGRLRSVPGSGIDLIVPFLDRVAHPRGRRVAIATTVAGIVRAEIGMMELDEVRSNRAEVIARIKAQVADAVDDRGIAVTRAEGEKRAVELSADAELHAAEQTARARRIAADAEAHATEVVARAIADNGLEAAQYPVAFEQVEALAALGAGEGRQTVIVVASAMDAGGAGLRDDRRATALRR
jgi:regulator of protease activity HflC (stomatin/prohibitin superfamily)